MKRGLFAATAALATFLFSSAALAAGPCEARKEVIAKLAKDYSETPVAIGMASNGGVLEVLAAKADSQSFTIIVTMPNGVACMLASGQHFEMLQLAEPVKGDPV